MSEALALDCIRTARAKGLVEKTVIYSHAFRNALIPIITLVIGWFIGIFSGSLVVENIFGLNGVGRIYILSLQNKDFEVALLLQMFYVVVGLLGNLVIDLAYGLADPRVRVNK
jgi:peptide/nickel transport system permease protein